MTWRWLCISVFLPLTLGCERRSEDLPEWRPEDHDHQIEPSSSARAAPAATPAAPPTGRPPMALFERFGVSPEVLSAWKQNCASCHGLIGRGDGPQGALFRARNLADPAWQRVALDDEIERAIQKGKGRMPGFPQLSPETVTGLVRFVRLMNPERPAEPDSPHGSPAAGDSPPPPGAGSVGAPGPVAPGTALPPGHP